MRMYFFKSDPSYIVVLFAGIWYTYVFIFRIKKVMFDHV